MKAILAIIFCSLIFTLTMCGKDKFESKPRLEFDSYNKIVDSPGILRFKIKYFDKEGDLSQAPFTIIKLRINNFPPVVPVFVDTFYYNLPEFPSKDKAEIDFQLDYNFLDESKQQNDTLRFKFAVTDRAGHNSDTLLSDIIVARKP